MIKGLNSAVVVTALGIVAAAPAAAGIFECYADVHDGCYLNTNSPCSDDDYQGLLDECDWNDYYAQQGVTAPAPPTQAFVGTYMSSRNVNRLRRLILRRHGQFADGGESADTSPRAVAREVLSSRDENGGQSKSR